MEKAPVRASRGRHKKIRERAGEIAMNRGKRREEASTEDIRQAERELLGLQTLPNPEDPLSRSTSP